MNNLDTSLIYQKNIFNLKNLINDKKLKIDEEGVYGETLLHAACLMGDLKNVELLIKAGFNINKTDFDGNAPLFYAIDSGRKNIITALIKAGAYVITQEDEKENYNIHLELIKDGLKNIN